MVARSTSKKNNSPQPSNNKPPNNKPSNNKSSNNKSPNNKSSNNLSNNSLGLSKKSLMNSIAHECVNGKTFPITKLPYGNPPIGNEQAYEESIGTDILTFSKKYTDAQKKAINCIIYHRANADGIAGAFLAWKFLTNNGKDKTRTDLILEPLDPGFVRGGEVNPRIKPLIERIRGKNVIGIDISLNKASLEALNASATNMIWIDDHETTREAGLDNIFVGKGHAACAYVNKFFNPTGPTPMYIQYIDNSDAKLFLPYLAYTDLFNLAFGVRITNNVMLSRQIRDKVYGGMFEQMLDMFPDNKQPSFMILIGNYMNEVRENIKYEIANLAQPAKFQGYNVGVLNFDAPGLAKVVGRQIVSNFKSRGSPIDFSVIWAYQYLRREYRVQLATDHSKGGIDVSQIAAKIGALPEGGREGGGGHPNMASFYWKGNIFDIFTKQLI
jgi:hypothetical protein